MKKKINQKIIDVFKKRMVPWNNYVGTHANAINHKKYNGVNVLLLNIAANEYGFKNRWWATAEQLNGHKLKFNAKGTEIIAYKRGIFGVTAYPEIVYNLDQVEGDWAVESSQMRYEDMDSLITATKVKFNFVKCNVAEYYYPPKDYIQMPSKEMFLKTKHKLNGFYGAVAHELMHWSESKLGWPNDVNKYPRVIREFRAEMGEALLMTEMAIPHGFYLINYLDYVDEWVYNMKQNEEWLFKAALSACKGVDFLLSFIKAEEKVA